MKVNDLKIKKLDRGFEIIISDGFVAYQYKLDFENADDRCIQDIFEALRQKFDAVPNKGIQVASRFS